MRQYLSRERWLNSWTKTSSALNSLWSRVRYCFSRRFWAEKWSRFVRRLSIIQRAIATRYHTTIAGMARIIVFLVPVVLLILVLVGGSSLVLRLFFLSVLVPVVSYLWVRLSIQGINVQADELPERCQVGEQFQQEITIANNSRIPKLWLKVEGDDNMPGEHNAAFLSLSAGASQHWQSKFSCQRRGRYSLSPAIVTATDPLGLFSVQRNMGEKQDILVYPATYDIPLFKLSSFSDFGYGLSHQTASLISPNASSVREFATGDSLHHIHWRSTAHSGKFMVKVFDSDRSYGVSKTIWVIVDMEQASHYGEGEDSTEEYTVTTAASLVRKHLESGMRVGMMASGDRTYLFPPERGENYLWGILEALALMKASGEVPVGRLILEQMEHFRDDSVVIIVTPSDNPQLVDVARLLRNRVESVVAVLLDAASFDGDTHTVNTARSLSFIGVQVYTVKQGDELATALDNRFSLLQSRYN